MTIGQGAFSVTKLDQAQTKDAIEKEIISGALSVAKSIGIDLYKLIDAPVQNTENDWDFTLPTVHGDEYLDLQEVKLNRGPYEKERGSYPINEMAQAVWSKVHEKSEHYGVQSATIHLLLYSTDWRLLLTHDVLNLIAREAHTQEHIFRSIHYFMPDSKHTGQLTKVYPVDDAFKVSAASESSGKHIAFGNMAKAFKESDGSVIVPIDIPWDSPSKKKPASATLKSSSRIWVCPKLCGCKLKMTALWVHPSFLENGETVTYGHPVPYTISQLEIQKVCSEHEPWCDEPLPDNPYGGGPGYIKLPITNPTRAQKLYIRLYRYNSQSFRPDTCGCVIVQSTDRFVSGIQIVNHPQFTHACEYHQGEGGQARALEENQLKNNVESLITETVPRLQIGTFPGWWSFDSKRTLHLSMTKLKLSHEEHARLDAKLSMFKGQYNIQVN